MLTELQLRNFRCFDALALHFEAGFNFFIGANGEGKTSLLEAACVLLRLQSPRSTSLAPLVRRGEKSFRLRGCCDGHDLKFQYGGLRRRLLFDEVEQRNATEYLRVGRVVSLANTDIEMARGGAETRRRYLDFLGAQIDSRHRPALRAYERALRARNALLKSPHPRPREIAAYDAPLVAHGELLLSFRAALARRLAPLAAKAHAAISGNDEALAVKFAPGAGQNFAEELAHSRAEERRLRQTIVGPHRDDLEISVQEMPAAQFASEGQQRTVALALKIAQASVLAEETGAAPLLLIDDIFGELDPGRRNALLAHLPDDSQKFVTATSMAWCEGEVSGPTFRLAHGKITRRA